MKTKTFNATATGEETKTEPSAKRVSTGPRSDAGKRRSSRNAIRHGLFTDAVVIAGESVTGFRALVRAIKEDLGITGATAEILIEKLAVTLWRHARLYRAEGAEILQSAQLRDRFLKEHFHDLNFLESESLQNYRADSAEPPQTRSSEPSFPSIDQLANLISIDRQLSREIDCIFGQLEHVCRLKKLISARSRPGRPS
jgi:hypothetical protein